MKPGPYSELKKSQQINDMRFPIDG